MSSLYIINLTFFYLAQICAAVLLRSIKARGTDSQTDTQISEEHTETEFIVLWGKKEYLLPYFSIDNVHPKLFRHSF
jgi:hypothetical protein